MQGLTCPVTPCEPASFSVIRREPANRLCSSTAPPYGVAASRSLCTISTLGRPLPVATSTGRCCLTGQVAQGRFIQALDQVMNGACWWMRVLSRSHFRQLVGHLVSVHSTAV